MVYSATCLPSAPAHPCSACLQGKLTEVIAAMHSKCSLGDYAEKTPEKVKAADADKLAKLQAEADVLQSQLDAMRAML